MNIFAYILALSTAARSARQASAKTSSGAMSTLMLCAVLGMTPVFAAEHESVLRDVQAGRLKPLAEILENARAIQAARVLDVDLEQALDGRRWYEVSVVSDSGQQQNLYFDAVTGEQISRPDNTALALMPVAQVLRGLDLDPSTTVLQVEFDDSDDFGRVYEIELLLSDGIEQVIRADAASGQIIRLPSQTTASQMPLSALLQMIEQLEADYLGRVTEFELKRSRSGELFYEVDIARDNGRSVELVVQADSGEILQEDDD